MDKELISKLDQRIESFITEMRPENDHMFTYDELMPIYENKLKEYSNMVFGESSNDFTDEMLLELKESIYPAVREATDGTDEIITSILIIELSKIIYQYEKDVSKNLETNIDIGRDVVIRASNFLFGDFKRDGNAPMDKLFNTLGKHVYRNQSNNVLNQSSGCLVIFISLIGSIFIFINL